jgi:hypothetical protein
MHIRTLVTALVVLLAALAIAPGAEAKAKHKRHCAIAGGRVVASNGQAVLLRRTTEGGGLGFDDELWGCLRARRKPFLIASGESDQYGDSHIRAVKLAGTFVGYTTDGGFIDGSCQAAVYSYHLVGRHVKYSYGLQGGDGQCPAMTDVAVSSHGLLAWGEQVGSDTLTTIRKHDHRGESTVDAAADKPAALQLEETDSATVISWSHGGTRRHKHLY